MCSALTPPLLTLQQALQKGMCSYIPLLGVQLLWPLRSIAVK